MKSHPILWFVSTRTTGLGRDGQMVKKLFFEEMDEEEMRKVTGGKNAFDPSTFFKP